MDAGCREYTNPWEILGNLGRLASSRVSSKVGIALGDAGAGTRGGRLQGTRPTQGETQSIVPLVKILGDLHWLMAAVNLGRRL